MRAAFLRLMTIVALVTMPVVMVGAPASASMKDHHSAASAEHCAEPGAGDDEAPDKAMDCKAACSALAASSAAPSADRERPSVPRDLLAATIFDDTIPEIATPPPRLG